MAETVDYEIYVYALVHPETRERRYIGITGDMKRRLREHIRESTQCGDTYKQRWIRSLLNLGLEPEMELLETVFPGADWDAREKWWIAWGRSQGWRLTNATDGGEGLHGVRRSLESRRRESEKRRLRFVQRMADLAPDVLAMHQTGAKPSKIGRALRTSSGTVEQILINHGRDLESSGKQSVPTSSEHRERANANRQEIISMYTSGLSVRKVGLELHIPPNIVSDILKEEGVLRDTGRKNKQPRLDSRIESIQNRSAALWAKRTPRILELYSAGYTINDIRIMIGGSCEKIAEILTSNGVTLRPQGHQWRQP